MARCFVLGCKHYSGSHSNSCRFYRFPIEHKKPQEYKKWLMYFRTGGKKPHSESRVCSCHFKNGIKKLGPETAAKNVDQRSSNDKAKCKSLAINSKVSLEGIVKKLTVNHPLFEPEVIAPPVEVICQKEMINQIIAQQKPSNSEPVRMELPYLNALYSASKLGEDIFCIETGLPTKKIFQTVVDFISKSKESINYHAGWEVTNIPFDDQVFVTLIKLRQNYSDQHLAQLFSCCEKTVENIVLTFIPFLHRLLFKQIMGLNPLMENNKSDSNSLFPFSDKRKLFVASTEVSIVKHSIIQRQGKKISSRRNDNNFKVLIGTASNEVISYVSDLHPRFTSEKEILRKSGLLSYFESGDIIVAGIIVNLLNMHDDFDVTKCLSKCKTNSKRIISRLKDFKILDSIPLYLSGSVDLIFELCASLVNLQLPLIKDRFKQVEDCLKNLPVKVNLSIDVLD